MQEWLKAIRDTEPARWAELARGLLAVLVAGGWITLDQPVIEWIVTGVGMLGSVLLTRFVRRSVFSAARVKRMLHGVATPGVPYPVTGDTPAADPVDPPFDGPLFDGPPERQ